jgi:hypothetical protein
LRSDFAKNFFGDVSVTLVSWYNKVIEASARSKTMALRDRFMRNNMASIPHQVAYILRQLIQLNLSSGFIYYFIYYIAYKKIKIRISLAQAYINLVQKLKALNFYQTRISKVMSTFATIALETLFFLVSTTYFYTLTKDYV